MAKYRRGAKKSKELKFRLSLEGLLDSMGMLGVNPSARLLALAIFSLDSIRPENAFDLLTHRTGLAEAAIRDHLLPTLESYGYLDSLDNGEALPRIKIPTSQPEKPKPRKSSKSGNHTVSESVGDLINEYKRLWFARYGEKCVTNGQDRSKALSLVKELGYEEVLRRLKNYMRDSDKWLVERGHHFGIFAKLSNRYTRRANGKAATGIIQHGSGFDEEVKRFEEGERHSAQK